MIKFLKMLNRIECIANARNKQTEEFLLKNCTRISCDAYFGSRGKKQLSKQIAHRMNLFTQLLIYSRILWIRWIVFRNSSKIRPPN